MTTEITTQPTLLIVEDDAELVEIFRLALAGEGFQVVTTADGSQCLSLARQTRPAAILLDLLVPGRSGHDLLHDLKEDAELGSIPVIVVSGVAQHLSDHDFELADVVIDKPFDFQELVALVRRRVRRLV